MAEVGCMKKFTITEKSAGEMAVRRMSDKAQEFYSGADPLNVYEYEQDEKTLYAYDGLLGESFDMTFEELEKEFESLQDEIDAEEEE